MDVAFIDHYDSFSFNVMDWLSGDSSTVCICRVDYDDEAGLDRLLAKPIPLILSPGPGHPTEMINTQRLAQELLGKVPILGICLGHQILGVVAGATIRPSLAPFHGSVRTMSTICASSALGPIASTMSMAVYHSLVVDQDLISHPWKVLALDALGEVAAINWELDRQKLDTLNPQNPGWPALGVQFHPESYLCIQCPATQRLKQYWLNVVQNWYSSKGN